MKAATTAARSEKGGIALCNELPLAELEHDLEKPLPEVRGVNRECVAVAMAGDAPNPTSFVERVHGEQYDKDVAGALEEAERGYGVLRDFAARAHGKIEALRQELKSTDRHEHVPHEAKQWTGFERFRVVFLGVLSFVLLVASMQQLAQLLLLGGYTETLMEGLRFAFIPLTAVAGLEILGQKLLVGDKAQRNYCRALAGVLLSAVLLWAHLFTSEYGTSMSATSDIDLDALLDMSGAGSSESEPASGGGAGPLMILAGVIAEIFGAALIWLSLARDFETHAPWRLTVKAIVRETEKEIEELSLVAANAARLEASYEGRVNKLRHGREVAVNNALTMFHRACGERDRKTRVAAELTERSTGNSKAGTAQVPKNRLSEPSSNGASHA